MHFCYIHGQTQQGGLFMTETRMNRVFLEIKIEKRS